MDVDLAKLDVATWRTFSRFPPDRQAGFLQDEYPQSVAVILAILARVTTLEEADAMLPFFPEMFAREVVKRRAYMADVRWWVILELERQIRFLVEAWNDSSVWTDDERERWRQVARDHDR